MLSWLARSEMLFGGEAVQSLSHARVIVFGVGGVGSFVVEALARSGVGTIAVVDDDVVALTNLNRQLFALRSTIGMNKVDVAEQRIRDINPDCVVEKHQCFFTKETADSFDFSKYDYVADCIDTVSGKLEIITRAKKAGVPVISAMGAGNKVHPELFEVADISETSVCPLARVMRKEVSKRGISGVKVVYSKEKPVNSEVNPELAIEKNLERQKVVTKEQAFEKKSPGSCAFVPSVAGLIMAGEILRDLMKPKEM